MDFGISSVYHGKSHGSYQKVRAMIITSKVILKQPQTSNWGQGKKNYLLLDQK